MASDSQPPAPKGRLISHFENRPAPSHAKAWSDLWDSGEDSLWDRGMPSPALIDLLENYQDTLLHPMATQEGNGNGNGNGNEGQARKRKRKRALVPGCGRGYDVLTLALHGFDAVGLEISGTAVSAAREFAERELQLSSSGPRANAKYFGEDFDVDRARARQLGLETGTGKVHFCQGDFFDDSWLAELDADEDGDGLVGGRKFDLVYDYTFLCALHPSQRPHWARRMRDLLRPGGLLVCLEFPMYKDPALPGPPWGVNGVHWGLLASEFSRRVYVRPRRTFEVGTGTDMLSVWERRGEGCGC
ncbi:uncharacterized protein DSM5745_02343 [Aspergillus mulundensis]|uniref:Thiol methyltransferase n=1 Tax=Aspergillus mulundensis TaxID=1810919 RepID=A0A3D8SXS0_9EURO|nr:hypothetical protein DSM5745_02343 [Aspergillus mulundensis]RDW90568.1 hypothetical protein DSM5745_02343 [Aspergillus mulundensis]